MSVYASKSTLKDVAGLTATNTNNHQQVAFRNNGHHDAASASPSLGAVASRSSASPLRMKNVIDMKSCVVAERIARSAIKSEKSADAAEAFYVADLGELNNLHDLWTRSLPRVRPFYAVKCNPDVKILTKLRDFGCGFDCASLAEIQAVLEMGVSPDDIIFAHPCKGPSHIKYARNNGIFKTTFDNEDELYKIKEHYPESQLVLRVLADDSKSLCRLGLKFGAPVNTTRHLLEIAKRLDLNVIGVSFHVGSGCQDAAVFADALWRAHTVFKEAAEIGYTLSFLDIGGGFIAPSPADGNGSCPEGVAFTDIATIVAPLLDQLFPPHVRVIAEPGRFFAAPVYTLAVNVTSRRLVTNATVNLETGEEQVEKKFMYYINEGLYSSFNCVVFDHTRINPKVVSRPGHPAPAMAHPPPLYDSYLWGPTCDSADIVAKDIKLPELYVGDWLIFEHFGAYTLAASSSFNGFSKANVIYIDSSMQ